MTHLTPAGVVDALDDVLDVRDAAHLAACATCQAAVAEARRALRLAETVEVPEPSPLFWDHLSARVRAQIDAGPAPASQDWRARLGWRASVDLVVIVAVVAMLAIVAVPRLRQPFGGVSAPQAVTAGTAVTVPDGPISTDDLDAADSDVAWALVSDLAEQVEWDATHDVGISARPDSAERLTEDLSAPERRALAQLLADEIGRGGA